MVRGGTGTLVKSAERETMNTSNKPRTKRLELCLAAETIVEILNSVDTSHVICLYSAGCYLCRSRTLLPVSSLTTQHFDALNASAYLVPTQLLTDPNRPGYVSLYDQIEDRYGTSFQDMMNLGAIYLPTGIDDSLPERAGLSTYRSREPYVSSQGLAELALELHKKFLKATPLKGVFLPNEYNEEWIWKIRVDLRLKEEVKCRKNFARFE